MASRGTGTLIAIHGVGTPKLGEVVTELSKLYPDAAYARNDVAIAGTKFARLVSEGAGYPDLLEVNWSDVKRPPRSMLGVAEWTIALSFGLARADLRWSTVRPLTGRVLAVSYEMVLLWSIYPVLLGLMHANLSGYALAIADAVVIGMAVLALRMTRNTTRVAATAGKVTGVVLPVLAGMLWVWPEWASWVDPIAVRAYGVAQIGAAVLITVTGVEVVMLAIRRKVTVPGAMARLAFAYLPLALLSALGSCIWAVSLNIVVRLRQSEAIEPVWQAMFVRNLGYNLKWVEWAMAGVTAVLGLMVIMAALNYRFSKPLHQGRVAQAWIGRVMFLAPVFLAIPGALLALTSPYFGEFAPAAPSQNVLQVYTVSGLRILPWLVAAITPVAALLDVLADVVFYITDRQLRFSSFDVCNDRLNLLLKYAQSRYRWIHVVAHSQGSVVAHTTLSSVEGSVPMALTTMGSPLGPLYAKYLDWSVTRPVKNWRNLFRSGDYIGGAVGIAGVDEEIGTGGHTGYWGDLRVAQWVGRAVMAERVVNAHH